ncbi:MAG: hypothetical protein JST04_06500 [Bdellovibrionales bacterium]|nr:hypothetical protein [Bdellovibrionales bacterium]
MCAERERVLSRRRCSAFWGFAALVFGASLGSVTTRAADNPYRRLLDDPFPAAAEPVKALPTFYRWKGVEDLPAGAKLEWDEHSTQWSRIDERIVLPRARVKIEIPGVDGVLVSTWERTTPLRLSTKGSWFGEVMVPLVSGEASKLSVWVRKGKTEKEYPLTLERVGGGEADSVGIDHSCSPWGVELVRRGAPSSRPALALVDCRLVRSESADGLLAALDLFLFLDGSGDTMKMNGSTVKAEAPSLFRFRLYPQNQAVILESATGDSFELRYRIPTKLNRGFLGVGIGPYRYHLAAPNTDFETNAGVFTLYGSYQFSETVKFTAFNATAIHKNYFTDTGLYFKSESAKILDQRVTLYLMLGANFVGFKYGADTQKKWGAPQGFEAVYSDFLSPNHTLVFGAFIYPPIDGKSYYNSWIRYGSGAIFGELNYLSIRNQFDGESVYVRALGFSLGFPLAKFF